MIVPAPVACARLCTRLTQSVIHILFLTDIVVKRTEAFSCDRVVLCSSVLCQSVSVRRKDRDANGKCPKRNRISPLHSRSRPVRCALGSLHSPLGLFCSVLKFGPVPTSPTPFFLVGLAEHRLIAHWSLHTAPLPPSALLVFYNLILGKIHNILPNSCSL